MRNRIPAWLLLAIGLALVAGGILLRYAGDPQADGVLDARCRAELSSRGPEGAAIAEQCTDPAFAGVITAQDAGTAAQRAGAANRGGMVAQMLPMFLLGLGAALILGGAAALFRKR